MSVLIDTSAFYALAHDGDKCHNAAVQCWRDLLDTNEMLTTSNYVVLESTALLYTRHGISAVRRFVEDVLPAVRVIWVDEQTHALALSRTLGVLVQHGPSLVDCVSFELMRRHRIDKAFTYNQDYERVGFTMIG
jgi:predicted nucleic acid-binding protein